MISAGFYSVASVSSISEMGFNQPFAIFSFLQTLFIFCFWVCPHPNLTMLLSISVSYVLTYFSVLCHEIHRVSCYIKNTKQTPSKVFSSF